MFIHIKDYKRSRISLFNLRPTFYGRIYSDLVPSVSLINNHKLATIFLSTSQNETYFWYQLC